MTSPNWKTAKNGAKYWTVLAAYAPKQIRNRILLLTFFKTKNKLTLRAKLHGGQSSLSKGATIKDVNILTFYLRKGRTLEVYLRVFSFPSVFDIGRKPKFKNVSNCFHTYVNQLSKQALSVGDDKIKQIFSTGHLSDQARIVWFCNQIEAALQSLMEDSGLTFESPTDYIPIHRFSAGILEFRYPILKTMREDWIKYHKSLPHPVKTDDTIKKVKQVYKLNLNSIKQAVLEELGRCKTIKDVIRRFAGNEGKVSTRIIFKNFFQTSAISLSEDQFKMFNLTGKTTTRQFRDYDEEAGEYIKQVDREFTPTMYNMHTGRMNCELLSGLLVLKKVLSVDHLNALLTEYDKDLPGFTCEENFLSCIYALLNEADAVYLYDTREVAYKHTIGGDPSAMVEYRKSLKKFKRDHKKVIRGIQDFLSMLGDSKKIFKLIRSTQVSFFHDTYKQWYTANDKITLPDKVRNLTKLHDYVSKEYGKLTGTNYGLGLIDIDWVKPLDMLEFSDMKTKRHFMIEVPRESHQLIQWGQKMNNCIGSYSGRVKSEKGRQVLLAIHVDGEMKYNLEINDKKIVQFYGQRNSSADPEDKAVFLNVVKEVQSNRYDFVGMIQPNLNFAPVDIQINPNPALQNEDVEQVLAEGEG